MRGTKFFVLKMNDLIRIGLFVLLGLVLLILALVFLFPNRTDNSREQNHGVHNMFVPGTYTSTIILNDKPVEVQVTVDETEILSITMTDMAEIQQVFYPLFEPEFTNLAAAVLTNQTAAIDPATDWPVTAGILQQAVKAALEMAVVQE